MRRLLAAAAIAVALVPATSTAATAGLPDLPPVLCGSVPDPETGEYYCFP